MYEIKLAPRNYTIMGFYKDGKLDFSLTSVDFYNVFDALCEFLNKKVSYTKPKLYSTIYDHSTEKNNSVYFDKYWSYGHKLLIGNKSFAYNYGCYTIEEYEELFECMKEYVLNTTKDMIFNCSSGDISNIRFNPYTIYKDVYPTTKITLELMVYFITQGEWVYKSKTLQENLDYIHNKYENESIDFITKTKSFQDFLERVKHIQDLNHCFGLLNNYKKY